MASVFSSGAAALAPVDKDRQESVMRKPSRLTRFAGAAALAGLVAISPPGHAQSASDDLPPPRDATVAPRLKLVELIGGDYPVAQATDALAAPVITAASLAKLRQGAMVKVTGLIEGNRWYQVQLPDGTLGYVEVAAIPAVTQAALNVGTAEPNTAPSGQEQPSQTAPAGSTADGPALDLPPILDFLDRREQLRIINATAAYLAPDKHAPQAYPLTVGTMIEVVAKSRDGAWDWVMAADGTPLYIPNADAARPVKPEQAAQPGQHPAPGQ